MKIRRYFPKIYNSYKDIRIEVDLSNYVTKSNANKPTGADTSLFANKIELASLKSDVDIDIRYNLDIS